MKQPWEWTDAEELKYLRERVRVLEEAAKLAADNLRDALTFTGEQSEPKPSEPT